MIEILAAPFVACLILTGILCYFGIHVIMREVIFVDLALAQIAAMGVAVGALLSFDPHSTQAYFCALAFTITGAAIFTIGRFRDSRVPQEAIIGITYAVSVAVTLLILSKIAIEQNEIEDLLVGRLLFVDWPEVWRLGILCVVIGIIHLIFGKRFFAISDSSHGSRNIGLAVYAWDFLFYATFGLVVTSSVRIAGVLLVFSYLIVPVSCAMIFFTKASHRLVIGWILGILTSAGGLGGFGEEYHCA